MRPLEHRRWFSVLSLALSCAVMGGLWVAVLLPVSLAAIVPFLFATLGLHRGLVPLLALGLIHYKPALGVTS